MIIESSLMTVRDMCFLNNWPCHHLRHFQKHEVEDYEQKRYRGLDQKFVDAREKKILRKILNKIGEDLIVVLDVPSGYGRFSGLLLERRVSLVSSDLSFHMVKRARERSKRPGSHFAVVADAKKGLPFKKGVFSTLLSIRFFHHLHEREERESVHREFFRVSAKWMILSYYQKNFLHFIQRKFRRRIKKSKTRIKMISRSEFQMEVENAGFNIVKIFPLFRDIHAQHIALLKKD